MRSSQTHLTRFVLTAALSIAWAGLSQPAQAQNLALGTPVVRQTQASVDSVDSVAITVSDMDKALEFYTQALPFEKISDTETFGRDFEELQGVFGLRIRVVRLKLGEEFLELHEYLTPKGRSIPETSKSNDRWFQHVAIIVNDMDKAYAQLKAHHLRYASTAPQLLPNWNPNAGGIKAFYFKDPDNHVLEILQFPAGKGNPKWQKPTDKIFLGIDHTAIVVGDTEESLKFYRDTLGFKVAGESNNYGDEQEHLNNVFGARLRITSLKVASGPAIELLEYLSPKDGRPYPVDSRGGDLWQWQTRLTGHGLDGTMASLAKAKTKFISPGVVTVANKFGFVSGLTFRDPDGHAMQITE